MISTNFTNYYKRTLQRYLSWNQDRQGQKGIDAGLRS